VKNASVDYPERIVDFEAMKARFERDVSHAADKLMGYQSDIQRLEDQVRHLERMLAHHASIAEELVQTNATIAAQSRTASTLSEKVQTMNIGAVILVNRARELKDADQAADHALTKDDYARAIMEMCITSVEGMLQAGKVLDVIASLLSAYGGSPPVWLQGQLEEFKTKQKRLEDLENAV
jgi:hypothetical protein